MKELLGLVGFGPEEETPRASEAADSVRPAGETVTATRTATVEQPRVEKAPEQPKVVEKPAVAQATDLDDTQKKVASTVERSFFGFGRDKEKEKTPEFGEVKAETVPEIDPYFVGWEKAEEPQRPPFIRPGATVIAAGATFFGDIRAEGDVEVLGKLKGNLEATGNIRVVGKIGRAHV